MRKKPKTVTVGSMVFHVPCESVFCEKCETTNYIYIDDLPPYHCNDCGTELSLKGENDDG